ncbi:MAG: hypothetical protein AAF764_11815 [Pseudomonadota bacterium]
MIIDPKPAPPFLSEVAAATVFGGTVLVGLEGDAVVSGLPVLDASAAPAGFADFPCLPFSPSAVAAFAFVAGCVSDLLSFTSSFFASGSFWSSAFTRAARRGDVLAFGTEERLLDETVLLWPVLLGALPGVASGFLTVFASRSMVTGFRLLDFNALPDFAGFFIRFPFFFGTARPADLKTTSTDLATRLAAEVCECGGVRMER